MKSYALPSSRIENHQGFFQGICDLLGEEVAAKLVAKYGGGGAVYIPAKINTEHPLSELLGINAAQYLSNEYGGLSIQFPRNYSLILAKRNGLIKADSAAGMSQSEIAIKYHLTTRSIYTILKKP